MDSIEVQQPTAFISYAHDSEDLKGKFLALARYIEGSSPDLGWSHWMDEKVKTSDYVFVWIDLFSRQVVGWKIDGIMQESLVSKPSEKALLRRRIKPGLIIHSDRGDQYLSRKMKQLVKTFSLKQSMASADDPYDNACAESFWGRMKAELAIPKGGYKNLIVLRSVLLNIPMDITILIGCIHL